MEEQFVIYEIALKLKELGFNLPCFSAYTENGNLMDIGDYADYDEIGKLDGHSYSISCLAPLWQQVIDWFREIHGLYLEIQIGIEKYYFLFRDRKDSYGHELFCIEDKDYNIAREQAILKTIELCKK